MKSQFSTKPLCAIEIQDNISMTQFTLSSLYSHHPQTVYMNTKPTDTGLWLVRVLRMCRVVGLGRSTNN